MASPTYVKNTISGSNVSRSNPTFSFTLEAGDNRCIVVFHFRRGNETDTTCTFNSNGLTKLITGGANAAGDVSVEVWYRAEGSSGSSTTANIVVTCTSSPLLPDVVIVVQADGVRQPDPIGASAKVEDTTASSATVDVSITVEEIGSLILAAGAMFGGDANPWDEATVNANQTERVDDETGTATDTTDLSYFLNTRVTTATGSQTFGSAGVNVDESAVAAVELLGLRDGSSNRPSELHGKETVSNGRPSEIHGKETVSNGRPSEIHGKETVTNGRGAEIHGKTTASDGRGAEINGYYVHPTFVAVGPTVSPFGPANNDGTLTDQTTLAIDNDWGGGSEDRVARLSRNASSENILRAEFNHKSALTVGSLIGVYVNVLQSAGSDFYLAPYTSSTGISRTNEIKILNANLKVGWNYFSLTSAFISDLATLTDNKFAVRMFCETLGAFVFEMSIQEVAGRMPEIATNNRPAELHGKTTASNNRPSELHGKETVTNGRPAEVHGKTTADNARGAEIQGKATATDGRGSEVHGKTTATNSRSAEIHGKTTTSSGRGAEIHGKTTASDGRPAEIHGKTTATNNRNAEIHGKTIGSSNRGAELTGYVVHPTLVEVGNTNGDTISASDLGGSFTDETTRATNDIVGGAIGNRFVQLSASAQIIRAKFNHKSALTTSSVIGVYVRSSLGEASDFHLIPYTSSTGVSVTNKISIPLTGVSVTNRWLYFTLTSAFIADLFDQGGNTFAVRMCCEDNAVPGTLIANLNIDELDARIPEIATSNRGAELHGKLTVSNNRNVEIHGKETVSSGRGAELTGHFVGESSRAAEIIGKASVSASRPCEIHGKTTGTDGRNCEIHGKATVSDSRSSEIRGSLNVSNNRSAEINGYYQHPSLVQVGNVVGDPFLEPDHADNTGSLVDQTTLATNNDWGGGSEDRFARLSRGASNERIIRAEFNHRSVLNAGSVIGVYVNALQGAGSDFYLCPYTSSTVISRINQIKILNADLVVGWNHFTLTSAFIGDLATFAGDKFAVRMLCETAGSFVFEISCQELAGRMPQILFDPRASELHGKDTVSDGRSAEIHGTTTASSNRSAEITGKTTASDGRSAEIHGKAIATDSRGCEIHGKTTATNNRNCEITGKTTATSSRGCELRGVLTTSDSRGAELNAYFLGDSSRSAEIHGKLSVTNGRPCELPAIGNVTNSREAEVTGKTTAVSSRSAEIRVEDSVTNARGAEIRGVGGVVNSRNVEIIGARSRSMIFNVRSTIQKRVQGILSNSGITDIYFKGSGD